MLNKRTINLEYLNKDMMLRNRRVLKSSIVFRRYRYMYAQPGKHVDAGIHANGVLLRKF